MTKVPGISAYALFKFILASLVTWASTAILFAVLVIATRNPLSIPVIIDLIVAVFAIASTFILARVTTRKREMENEAGYTSSPISMFEYPEMDVKSGKIIREANEPKLSPQERKSRLRAARLPLK